MPQGPTPMYTHLFMLQSSHNFAKAGILLSNFSLSRALQLTYITTGTYGKLSDSGIAAASQNISYSID